MASPPREPIAENVCLASDGQSQDYEGTVPGSNPVIAQLKAAQPVLFHTPEIRDTCHISCQLHTSIGPVAVTPSRSICHELATSTPGSLSSMEIDDLGPRIPARRVGLLTVGAVISALGASNPIRNRLVVWVSHGYNPRFDSSVDLICLGLFTVCITFLYHSDDPSAYKDLHLIGAIILGVMMGLFIGHNLHDSLFQIVPWTILVSTLITHPYHFPTHVASGTTVHASMKEIEKI